MTIDLTRRTLLHLAGASSLTAAAMAAAQAEGTAGGGGPTFANRTPMRIGMVNLRVRDLDKVADYYRDAIGLTVMARSMMGALLGTGGVALLHLQRRESATREARNAAGLYHTAFLMPTRKDLARWLVHAAKNRIPLSGFADHLVSESVYLDDPEGNGIEVYADRAPELWKWEAGSVAMATDQLDIDGLLALADTHTTNYAKAPDDLRIGHMHLRVGDLEQADRFYGAPLVSTRPASAAAPHSFPPGVITITSRSTSGRAPAPARAMPQPPGSRGFRWRSRRQKSCRRNRSACVRRARRPRRSRTASKHQIPGEQSCG